MNFRRRDFFGIIAAPLLRRLGPPPTPVAGTAVRPFDLHRIDIGRMSYVVPQYAAGEWKRKLEMLTKVESIAVPITFTPMSEI